MSRIASRRPEDGETEQPYYHGLINRVEGECVLKVLNDQLFWICELASCISTEQVDRIHAPYGWTIRQVFEHCANAERLHGCRIMCLADGSEPTLPNWDENVSAESRFGLGNFSHLVTELGELRKANIRLLDRISPRSWEHRGVVSGNRATVRVLGWLLAGHLQHHFEIVEKRCEVAPSRKPSMVE